ncbi:Uncharacterised protein [Mycobacterium tuberculosis]|uniref:Uncharacterized protein n=1 Tax=Mycobacterium tuberculosis TaxID=1773 RepID=A0A916LCJ5_MYCTX|nr:Uncharacterised protein [Mycobacterium tuberculosis]
MSPNGFQSIQRILLGGEAAVAADAGVEYAVRRLHRADEVAVLVITAQLGVDQRLGELERRSSRTGHRT